MGIIGALILNFLLAMLAFKKKMLSKRGCIIAYVIGVIIGTFSIKAYVVVLSFFLGQCTLEKIILGDKRENRNEMQVICNSIIALFSLMLAWIFSEYRFFFIYVILIAGSMGDSVASAIGTKYAKNTYSIITFKKVKKGVSGGISFVGTFAGVLGCMYIGIVYCVLSINYFRNIRNEFIYIVIGGTVGFILDSYLGQIFQKKYYCDICKKYVDFEYCCNEKAERINKAWKVLSNNGVNLFTNIILFLILFLQSIQ